jgi:transcription initiation factor TFIIF subunit alpha
MKQIARPIVPSTVMNETIKKEGPSDPAEQSATVDQLRHEFIQHRAVSIPLVVSRRDLKELRHHIMRLQAKGRVDVTDEKDFTPPIRLHRRDPRAPPSGAGSHFEEDDTKEDLEEIKERERLEIAKEERRKIREENLAKIAPSGTKKAPAFQKKTEQKFRPDDTPEAEKRRLLKYEETLPWHLEDFDNKQTWVGFYESELSETHVTLTLDGRHGQPAMRIVPMERWYKFSIKGKVGKLNTAEQAEDAFKKQDIQRLPKFLSNIEQISLKKETDYANLEKRPGRMKTRVGGGDDDDGAPRRQTTGDDDAPRIKREADADDIDFNLEEDFADDEEGLNGLFEGEEADVKEAAERLKRDQLAAAAFELRNEDDIYRQEEREAKEAEAQKILEKSIRKALMKREKNPDYDYGSDRSNPYASSSSESETDSETEQQRTKEEEERKAAEQNGKVETEKPGSGTSTKGSNTPSGSHKPVDVNKKKRPGSPNLSEASGNESSRKKHKKKHHSKHADGARKSSFAHLTDVSKRGAASGSDSEMTDAGKSKPKLKVRLGGSPSGSPGGSRAGSPAAQLNGGSRAGSPAASSATPAGKFHISHIASKTVLTA